MASTTAFPVRKMLWLPDDLAEQIKDYRHEKKIESENEAIRRLIKRGLKLERDSDPR